MKIAERLKLIITYKMLHNILTEAEERVRITDNEQVRKNSQETVDLCLEKMRIEKITRKQLKRGY